MTQQNYSIIKQSILPSIFIGGSGAVGDFVKFVHRVLPAHEGSQ